MRKSNIVVDIASADGDDLNLLESDSEFANLISVGNSIAPRALDIFQDAGFGDILNRSDPLTLDEVLRNFDEMPAVFGVVVVFLQLINRKLCVQLRILNKMDAYPVFSQVVPAVPLSTPERNAEIIDVGINALPIPDETVSWEHIIEFRSDPDSQSKFLALRDWMNEVARAEIPLNEIEVKFEHLIDEYQQHMKLHRMKTDVGKLHTFFNVGASLLDRKFTEAVKISFPPSKDV